MKLLSRSSAAALSGALLATSLLGAPAVSASTTDSQAGVRLEAQLRGGGAGDPDGTGQAVLRLYKGAGRVCANITWNNIGSPTAAHIHRKSDGAVRVDLTGSVTGGAKCRTGLKSKLVKRIANHPRRYYVNVHNADYPAGAIRGTLHR